LGREIYRVPSVLQKRAKKKKIRGDLRRRIPYLDGDERNLESVCDEESEKQSRE
jgi:hypothetical protein